MVCVFLRHNVADIICGNTCINCRQKSGQFGFFFRMIYRGGYHPVILPDLSPNSIRTTFSMMVGDDGFEPPTLSV